MIVENKNPTAGSVFILLFLNFVFLSIGKIERCEILEIDVSCKGDRGDATECHESIQHQLAGSDLDRQRRL